jgi:hypothetical protein
MAEIDEAAVLERAKALAEQDGYAWELNFVAPSAPYAPIKSQPYLGDEARKRYVERARFELRKEGYRHA